MRTLNVSISDIEYSKFGLKNDKLTFSDFIDIVSKELTRQNLDKCLELADKYGISKMSMDEITDEVKAVRQNAKNRNRH
jgi:predicted CopG family antitoxin